MITGTGTGGGPVDNALDLEIALHIHSTMAAMAAYSEVRGHIINMLLDMSRTWYSLQAVSLRP